MMIHVNPTNTWTCYRLPLLYCRSVGSFDDPGRDAKTRESKISSEVNKVGSLITDKTWSFNAVDCSWYRIGAGKDFQRPIRIIFVTDKLAARAIVGPDILIECVLNQSSLKPK